MIDEPSIPMRPQDRPPQRALFLSPLPPRPEGFQGYCEWRYPMVPLPAYLKPKGSPRKLTYLGAVEWAWSPMHSRADAYYLGRRGAYWLLWSRWEDDNQIPWKWRWSLIGHAKCRNIDTWTAACYLLMDAWAADASGSLDKYHWINDVGGFSVEDFEAIAAVVWPDAKPLNLG